MRGARRGGLRAPAQKFLARSDGPRAHGSGAATRAFGANGPRLASARASGSARGVAASASALDAPQPVRHRVPRRDARTRRRRRCSRPERTARPRPRRAARAAAAVGNGRAAPEANAYCEGPTSPSAVRLAQRLGRARRDRAATSFRPSAGAAHRTPPALRSACGRALTETASTLLFRAQASRPTSSASSSPASSWRTAARWPTTTSRRSRLCTWCCACAAANRPCKRAQCSKDTCLELD